MNESKGRCCKDEKADAGRVEVVREIVSRSEG